MGKGLLIGGIVLVIIGVIVSSASSVAQSYSNQQISQCNSLRGQLGQTFSEDVQQNCQTAAIYQSVSTGGSTLGWGFALIGIVLVVIGGIQMARRSKNPIQTDDHVNMSASSMTDKIFCRWCGKLRSVVGTFCPECGKSIRSANTALKICIFCSGTMSDDSVFCANCGRKF